MGAGRRASVVVVQGDARRDPQPPRAGCLSETRTATHREERDRRNDVSHDLDNYATAVWMGYRQRMAVGALVVQRQYSTLWPWRSEFDSRPRHFFFFFLRWRCSLPLCRLSVSAALSLARSCRPLIPLGIAATRARKAYDVGGTLIFAGQFSPIYHKRT